LFSHFGENWDFNVLDISLWRQKEENIVFMLTITLLLLAEAHD